MKRALGMAFIALSFASGAGLAAPRQDDGALLRLLSSGAPRQQFEPNVLVRGASGEMEPGVRCATRRPSDLERELVERIANALPRMQPGSSTSPVTVPVAFHIVRTSDGDFNVRAKQIRAQIKLLNDAFSDDGFVFRRSSVHRYRDNRFARRCDDYETERSFKTANAIKPDTTLNIYTCRPRDRALGWSTFPWSEDGPIQGVVALYSSFPGGGAAPFDEGDTVVHEAGHWLGLYHTFQGGCSARGDEVDDTPAQASPTSGCPDHRDSCAQQAGEDPIHNFMDYSDDRCMDNFTPGQGRRMRDIVATYRTGLGG